MAGLDIREGFLCPICLKDQETIVRLQEHVQTEHSEEHDPLQSIRDLFGKAKRKILKKETLGLPEGRRSEEPSFSYMTGSNTTDSFTELYWEEQEMGVSSTHTSHFKKIRESRVERYVIETNKLLIRLNKLITDIPSDPEKRKAHEKSIVQWVNDSDVRLCPSCARPFNLSRRRHHCRLCGGIMCHNCSEFVDIEFARKLVAPTMMEMPPKGSTFPRPSLQRRGSSSSLMSMVSPTTGDPHIRVCRDCKRLLDRRDLLIELQNSKPIVAQMYEKMKSQMDEAERRVPLYYKMAASLNAGESNYSLVDAQQERVKLTRLAESIDMISRKIAVLGSQDDPPPSPRMLQLQGGIRLAASHFLRETMLGIPSLPTEEELAKLQDSYRQAVQKRIMQEKAEATQRHRRMNSGDFPKQTLSSASSSSRSSPLTSPGKVAKDGDVDYDQGWFPNTAGEQAASHDDPMVQQMNIIRNFIKQAKAAHKLDEVQILEANLRELQEEYRKRLESDGD